MRTAEQYASDHGWTDRLNAGLEIQESTALWAKSSREKIGRFIRQDITVQLSSSMKTAAGYAYLDKRKITLHPGLAADPAMHEETFFHEVSHHVAWLLARDNAHGWAWGYCQMAFGFHPIRCHNKAASQLRQMTQKVSDDLLEQF